MERQYDLYGGHTKYGFAHLNKILKRGVANCWKLQLLVIKRDYRGRHYGSILLDRILRAADAEGATIVLTADPLPTCPMLPSKLRAFYRRHGFRSSRKDINQMIRRPVR